MRLSGHRRMSRCGSVNPLGTTGADFSAAQGASATFGSAFGCFARSQPKMDTSTPRARTQRIITMSQVMPLTAKRCRSVSPSEPRVYASPFEATRPIVAGVKARRYAAPAFDRTVISNVVRVDVGHICHDESWKPCSERAGNAVAVRSYFRCK